MPIVKLSDVSKSFGALQVFSGISLEVAQGEVVAIIGRSGSGKSTLLRCINGLERPTAGTIQVAGHNLSADSKSLRDLRKDVGMVFQSYNLFPHLTVMENIKLAPRVVKKLDDSVVQPLAVDSLRKVGLLDKSDAYPDELSGGQQQRVAIARSLAMAPKVILFDEVTSALDPELTGEVLKVMEQLARGGMTMILVTHEMAFARKVATTTVFMHAGKIWESGPSASVFENPATPELKSFISASLA